jgi:hypothetical protein
MVPADHYRADPDTLLRSDVAMPGVAGWDVVRQPAAVRQTIGLAGS